MPLNDEADYDGGRLLFCSNDGHLVKPPRPRGSMTVHTDTVRTLCFLLPSVFFWQTPVQFISWSGNIACSWICPGRPRCHSVDSWRALQLISPAIVATPGTVFIFLSQHGCSACSCLSAECKNTSSVALLRHPCPCANDVYGLRWLRSISIDII